VLDEAIPEIPATRAALVAPPPDPVAAELAGVVAHNRRRTVTLCAAPAGVVLALCTGIGAAAGALPIGLLLGVVLGLGCGTGLWRGSRRVVLGALRARVADEDDVPGPFTQVEGLCATMGLPAPPLYLVDEDLPGALALGRGPGNGAVVLTTGLLDTLDPVGIEGVLAHELAHLKRDDSGPATVAAALALVLGVRGSGAGATVHRLAGRGREFEADRMAVGATRYPPGLRQALATMTEGPVAPARAGTSGRALAERRVGQITRWLFAVVLPDRRGRRPQGAEATGELDAPSVRIAALDEW
jgi:Zn-dependent protease with chaperone function